MKSSLVFIVSVLCSVACFSQNHYTLQACQDFKNSAAHDGSGVVLSSYTVPLDYRSHDGKTMNIFYWIKKGSDPAKVPVLLIHGGPGGNSWRYYSAFKASTYTGDIVSIDNRNEGCSHVKDYNDLPWAYKNFRVRSIVMDLEILRQKLYGRNGKWRILGQSRGGSIAHHYLEMFPNAIESLHTQGWAMMTEKNIERYTILRSQFNVRAADRFRAQFPDVEGILNSVKQKFEQDHFCVSLNFDMADLPLVKQPKICGAIITDGLSYKLSNYARWKDIAAELTGLKNPTTGEIDYEKAKTVFTAEVNGNIYVQYFNYILGTNGLDVGSPNPRTFRRIFKDKIIMDALISEGRFVAQGVYPAYLSLHYPAMDGGADPIDFGNLRRFLKNYEKQHGEKFKLILFSSFYDSIAGPEMYQDEKTLLGDYVEVRTLHNSGHEGWQTEPDLLNTLFR